MTAAVNELRKETLYMASLLWGNFYGDIENDYLFHLSMLVYSHC